MTVTARTLIKAKYDAKHNLLRLSESLKGFFPDNAEVTVTLETPLEEQEPSDGTERPWADLENSLSQEGGEEMARVIEEEFPPTGDWSRYQR